MRSLVCFILLLTAFCTNYCVNSLVSILVGVTITWSEEEIVKKQFVLHRDVQSHKDLCMSSRKRRNKFDGPVWFSNPLFGGRGVGPIHNCTNKFKDPILASNNPTFDGYAEGLAHD